MQRCGSWPIGVCSWSLQESLPEVLRILRDWDIEHVHLALIPLLQANTEDIAKICADAPWQISATMLNFPQEDYSTLERIRVTGGIVPDDCWADNLELYRRAAAQTAILDVPWLTMHLGFIDMHEPASFSKLQDRTGQLADIAQQHQITLLLESGQESAEELKGFLESLDHPHLGINFDPANMILYDKGDPVAALHTLGPWIKHLHIKDALRTSVKGTWGTEVPWGQGQVNPPVFLEALHAIDYQGTLAIERESGEQRQADIHQAMQQLVSYCFSKE